MKCIIHDAPIKYLDIRANQYIQNRSLCQKCIPSNSIQTGIVTLNEAEHLIKQVIEKRLKELTSIQSKFEGILNEIKLSLETHQLQIFKIISEMHHKSIIVYENYQDHYQLVEQLCKDIVINQNQLEIKPFLYEDPLLIKHNNKLTDILNIFKPKIERMEIEMVRHKYQITRPLLYGGQDMEIEGHQYEYPVYEVTFSHDCQMAASCSNDKSVILWCFKTMKKLKIYNGHRNSVFCLAFSKCDTLLASGEGEEISNTNSQKIKQIFVWDITDLSMNRPLYIIKGCTDNVFQLIFTDNILLSCGNSKIIRLWNRDKLIACYEMKSDIQGMSLSSDEQFIAVNCETSNSIWQMGKQIIEWSNSEPDCQAGSICFSNNSKLIFTTSRKREKLLVWNCYTRQPKLLRITKRKYGTTCRVSSNSTIVVTGQNNSGYSEGYLHTFDIATLKETKMLLVRDGCPDEFEHYNYINFSRDDQYIGVGGKIGQIFIFRRRHDEQIDHISSEQSEQSEQIENDSEQNENEYVSD